ncbi:MAG: hypothetical protein QOJ14_2197, partial [Thermoleophilaceae bacterium]|nr:hypothetical protein [Thermoleophilaceae bacterium]
MARERELEARVLDRAVPERAPPERELAERALLERALLARVAPERLPEREPDDRLLDARDDPPLREDAVLLRLDDVERRRPPRRVLRSADGI